MKLKTKVLIIGLVIVSAFAVSISLLLWTKFRDLSSLRKVDDYPLYTMNYSSNYNLDKFLEGGVTDNMSDSVRRTIFSDSMWHVMKSLKIVRNETVEPVTACATIFTINNKGEKILGRNFDWINRPILLLKAEPDNGYSSFSMTDISYLGFTENFLPDSFLGSGFSLVFSPYVSFDGMNEMGLAIGEMAVPVRFKPRNDSSKVTIGDTHSIRVILDKAANVQEAVTLLRRYNINYPTMAWHYLIADREGNSSIIEYIDGQLVETKRDRNFQICTNDIVYDRSEDLKKALCTRYKKAYQLLDEKDGDIDQGEMMRLMEDISQRHTMWSIVYNMTTGDVLVVPGKKYSKIYQYKLKMRE